MSELATIEKHQIAALYLQGKSSLDIASITGKSKYWVLTQLRAAGVVRKPAEAFAISKTHGNSLRKKGSDCLSWKGGRKIHSDGYIQVMTKGHPYADRFGYVLQHRLVVEQSIGRFLLPSEDVHHRNGNRTDNTLENLELLSRSAHISIHAKTRKRSRGKFTKEAQWK